MPHVVNCWHEVENLSRKKCYADKLNEGEAKARNSVPEVMFLKRKKVMRDGMEIRGLKTERRV